MCNLRDSIFYMKANVLHDFHICISVPQVKKNISTDFRICIKDI